MVNKRDVYKFYLFSDVDKHVSDFGRPYKVVLVEVEGFESFQNFLIGELARGVSHRIVHVCRLANLVARKCHWPRRGGIAIIATCK